MQGVTRETPRSFPGLLPWGYSAISFSPETLDRTKNQPGESVKGITRLIPPALDQAAPVECK